MAKAIAHAKRAGATLCIAKLDRLARNVHFVSGLMESRVDFVACDIPFANKFTVHILAAVAEHEAEQISQRTKDALAAAKRQGTKLGAGNPNCRNLTAEARRKGAKGDFPNQRYKNVNGVALFDTDQLLWILQRLLET